MLTRLKVSGFKNLVDVDVRFGPFTCIAGANGVGKSNLFDAVRFLAMLADHELMDAAAAVRGESERSPDVRGLFTHHGATHVERMRFEAEMLVPPAASDHLGREGKARTTFLRYVLELGYRAGGGGVGGLAAGLEVKREELSYIQKGEAVEHLPFGPSRAWLRSTVLGACRRPLISTESERSADGTERVVVKLHQDGHQGRPSPHPAATLPRTVLSASSASESPTALCARREMASWTILQLEPSALRRASEFKAPVHLASNGANLAATLYHLAESADRSAGGREAVYCQVANRLSELIGGVDTVAVDRDDKRELLTVILRDFEETALPARSLSDGTLRFLALTVLDQDPSSRGTICLEEPENGIHPDRIPAMLRLLEGIATDPDFAADKDNPLRQVIVNTHSPAVVGAVKDDSLLVATLRPSALGGQEVEFGCLPGTWRAEVPGAHVFPKGVLLSYLNPLYVTRLMEDEDAEEALPPPRRRPRRVSARPDLQPFLPGIGEAKS